jgi:DNA-binding beta-propeller fold protein YncE
VTRIDRRKFLIVITIIVLLGIASLLGAWFYYSSNSKNDADKKNRLPIPEFISSVNKYGAQQMLSPMGVAYANGKIFVLDSGNGKIAVLFEDGSFENAFTVLGASEKELPVGIAIDKNNHIYVSMIGASSRIGVFSETGDFLYNFPQMNKETKKKNKFSKDSIIGRPVGLFVSDNKLFVTDVVDQDIKIFDLSGKLLKKFGKPGGKQGEFLYPNGITMSDDGLMFVSDSNNARVQVFNDNGSFAYEFKGPKEDSLALPRGLAFDKNNRLHVVDTLKHKVFIYTKQGKLLKSYGSLGSRGAGLSYPNAIAFDDTYENIYIADKQNNRLSIWRP